MYKKINKILLKLVSDCIKFADYKIKLNIYTNNTQNSIAFWHTSNERLEFGVKNTNLFILAPKREKHLGISLTKCIQSYEKKINSNIRDFQKT